MYDDYCNDTSQCSVATCWNVWLLLQIYCWVCFERIFKTAQHLAKVMGKSWRPQAPSVPEHCPAEKWRTCL